MLSVNFMSRIVTIKEFCNIAIDYWLLVADKAILKIPTGKLGFKPTEESRTVAELATHMYRAAYMLTRVVAIGVFRERDFQDLPFNPTQAQTPQAIVDYGCKVKQYMRDTLPNITEADLNKTVWYRDFTSHGISDWSRTGWESLKTLLEEILHHRGQLFTYLRLMGTTPPNLYDHTPHTS